MMKTIMSSILISAAALGCASPGGSRFEGDYLGTHWDLVAWEDRRIAGPWYLHRLKDDAAPGAEPWVTIEAKSPGELAAAPPCAACGARGCLRRMVVDLSVHHFERGGWGEAMPWSWFSNRKCSAYAIRWRREKTGPAQRCQAPTMPFPGRGEGYTCFYLAEPIDLDRADPQAILDAFARPDCDDYPDPDDSRPTFIHARESVAVTSSGRDGNIEPVAVPRYLGRVP